ncbi:hypothetical protein BGZ94_008770 [Podila epigama]|nr:hypothetical protein BGZ94_008770 [Podila epigama]
MMSNVRAGVAEPTTAGQGHASHRNHQQPRQSQMPLPSSLGQQRQHPQQLQQQQQQQQQSAQDHSLNHHTRNYATQPTAETSNTLRQHHAQQQQPQQQQQQQHSQGQAAFSHAHYNSHGGHQQQQRPPVAPTHHPRLHHSVSTGNINMTASAGRFMTGNAYGSSGSTSALTSSGSLTTAAAAPKKKDPYATAWRTYSKIAEELQLLNSDGSLYPISKEAILKYLHHQSKRIKSSNLHWYVNGLKKHQENLGFPWDDVRYDDQVVGLLKELTLHPVMVENGDEDHHGQGHAYGPQQTRQRQSSGNNTNTTSWRGGHQYSSSTSSVVEATRIANLSISQHSPQHSQSPRQHQHQHQQHNQQQHQQQQQPYMNSLSYGGGIKQQQNYSHHHSHQSQRIQQPPPPKPYFHSAPDQLPPSHHNRTPSGPDIPSMYANPRQGQSSQSVSQSQSHMHPQQHHHQQQHQKYNLQHGAATVGSALPPSGVDTFAPRTDPSTIVASSSSGLLNTKRKRSEFGLKKRRMPSSISLEGDDLGDEDGREDELKDDNEDTEDGRAHMDTFDGFDEEEEESSRYQPLKRRASTGTLLSQAKASEKQSPGTFDPNMRPKTQGFGHPHHYRLDQSPSPDRGHGLGGGYSSMSSREGRAQGEELVEPLPGARTQRPTSAIGFGGGVVGGGGGGSSSASKPSFSNSGSGVTTSSFTSATEAGTTTASMSSNSRSSSSKMTVQFSEVVECAQQLQKKYGNRCKDHAWGCVDIPHHGHLELTIKMYLDWAGLVASGRLTMDDLPDLPEFRKPSIPFAFSQTPLETPGSGGASVGGGTLKRMASTPFPARQHPIAFGTYRSSSRSRSKSRSKSRSRSRSRSRSPVRDDAPEDEDDEDDEDVEDEDDMQQSPPPRRSAIGYSKHLLDSRGRLANDMRVDGDGEERGRGGSVTTNSSSTLTFTSSSPAFVPPSATVSEQLCESTQASSSSPLGKSVNRSAALLPHETTQKHDGQDPDHFRHLVPRERTHTGSIVSTSTASSPSSTFDSDDEADMEERSKHVTEEAIMAVGVDVDVEMLEQTTSSTATTSTTSTSAWNSIPMGDPALRMHVSEFWEQREGQNKPEKAASKKSFTERMEAEEDEQGESKQEERASKGVEQDQAMEQVDEMVVQRETTITTTNLSTTTKTTGTTTIEEDKEGGGGRDVGGEEEVGMIGEIANA